ncbi:MAG: RagB/SusD family nutrient uptake outer membrane protein, partial [Bacteroidetes bacterium]|nr:RagB/SusD family nutrient uptake outer membrane protein [Bacteroidota bacterium]
EPQDDRFSEFAFSKSYVRTDGTVVYTRVKTETVKDRYWPSTKKWDWTHPEPARVTDPRQYGDQPYLRLAETYLLLAEAQMKLSKNAEAAEWINKIRRRANATEITAADVTLDFILDERSRELLTEEHRRYTLARTGTLISRTRLHNPLASGIQDFHVLWPIPQIIIDANTGKKIEQNLGYY